MDSRIVIQQATLVNEGEQYQASVLIENGRIERIKRDGLVLVPNAKVIEAQGLFLLPGVIDDHVHMREPGLTHKATMESETRAAAAGGVTSVMDMPNVVPQTTTIELLEQRYAMGAERCHVNYAFYLGATHDNLEEIKQLDPTNVPGVKLFMGSSTGNMLVDDEETLRSIFSHCPTLLMTHCEDTSRINQRMAEAQARYGEDPEVIHHPEIRDEEACYQSTQLAVKMARETGARLHVAHLTTARELQLFKPNNPQITAEACIAHLLFTDKDYARLGTRIKCNPAVKSQYDRDALRHALTDGRITLVATDHAPHLLSEKQGGCRKAASGMPMVQYSLPAMLTLADQGALSLERVVELMCHAPARLFGVQNRGFIREGYQADLVLVSHRPFTVIKEDVQSLCGWSPLEGMQLSWTVEQTWVNGQLVWDGKKVDSTIRGQRLRFTK
ncbi:MAG: dihydroorotase [Bacteroidaceae bacterium]|nr:dihydroorotase [Bacteroidaceae bacterium]